MKDKNRTKYTLLGMLALGNFTGYEIIKMIQNSTNYFWSESEGQIYPALAQCLKEKLATCKEMKSAKNSRPKKLYAITTQGRQELTAWLKHEAKPATVRNELLLKLFFGGNLKESDNLQHLAQRQKELEIELESYQKLHQELCQEHKNSPHLKYWLITLNCGIKSSKAELLWCKESIVTLKDSHK